MNIFLTRPDSWPIEARRLLIQGDSTQSSQDAT